MTRSPRAILSGRPEAITGVSGDSFAIAGGVSVADILGRPGNSDFHKSNFPVFNSYYVGYSISATGMQYLSQIHISQDNFYYSPVPLSIAAQTKTF